MDEVKASERGPSFGEPAPDFETFIYGQAIRLRDFRGKWVVIFSHPEDLSSIFKTRTIKYLLCKRRTKVIALGDAKTDGSDTGKSLLKKYILKHNLMIVDDSDGRIASSYGLSTEEGGERGKGVFIVDPKGILRVKLYFPLSSERNFYETLKLIDALQGTDRQKAVLKGCGGNLGRKLGMVIRQATEEGQAG